MLKKSLIVIAALVASILIYAAVLPSQMVVFRELTIHATPEVIFPYINHSQKANSWMPWKDSDPGVVMNYSGPEQGLGSKTSWDSKGQMGTGEALVVESIPNQSVKTELKYTKPFVMTQMAEVSLKPVQGGTTVKWSVSGHSGYFFKLMGIFVDCDKMIGGEFEKGLQNLKRIVENPQ